jgi:hypothetical protein
VSFPTLLTENGGSFWPGMFHAKILHVGTAPLNNQLAVNIDEKG